MIARLELSIRRSPRGKRSPLVVDLLKRCRRLRKSLVLSKKALAQHRDPAFNMALRTGYWKAWEDPEWRERQVRNRMRAGWASVRARRKKAAATQPAAPGLGCPQTSEPAPVGVPTQSADRRTPIPAES